MGTNEGVFIVCREVNRETGEVAVYRVDVDLIPQRIVALHLRSIFNPELRYYTVDQRWEDRFEELTQILGVHLLVSDETLRRFGIVKI